jgi:hypothetical protein
LGVRSTLGVSGLISQFAISSWGIPKWDTIEVNRRAVMYKVVYQLPKGQIREIVLSEVELKAWMNRAFLRARIISYERIQPITICD